MEPRYPEVELFQGVSLQQISSTLLDRGLAEDQAVVTRSPGRRRSLLAHNPLSPSGTVQRVASVLDDKSLMPAVPREHP